jgi:hypothetical protein
MYKGLFLGISLLSIFEVIDFIYLFIEIFVYNMVKAKKPELKPGN